MKARSWTVRILGGALALLLTVACGGPPATSAPVSTEVSAASVPTVSPSEPAQPSPTSEPVAPPPTRTSRPTQHVEPSPTATTARPEVPTPSYRVQIRVSTTSDWTTLRLAGGGTLHEVRVSSSSEEAQPAGPEGDSLVLGQSLARAEGHKSVELVAEALLAEIEAAKPLLFEIGRGHIGSTRVEISSYPEATPSAVAVLTWDGIEPGEQNAQTFEVSPAPFLDAAPNEYIVIGQLNLWYYGPGFWGGFENENHERNTPLTPLLGESYWSSDPAVVYQQIEWAAEYGVDGFSIEWITPRGAGKGNDIETILDDVFLKSPNIHKLRWAIFYDFPLRLEQTPGLDVDVVPNINFDQPDVYDTFVSDFRHFAKKYFGHPQYLAVDGRPVVYIWATNSFVGDLAGAMADARDEVSALGYDVFIVGDEVCVGCFNRPHAALFDGSSTFTMLIPGLDPGTFGDVGKAAVEVDGAFRWWRDQLSGLKVAGREDLVNFQPAWAPQYDDRRFNLGHPSYVPAQSKDQVVAMAEVARKHAEPFGTNGLKLIWLNTWNNWAETTTVEPTANLGPKYPAGNYQFDMLEVVRDVFGGETYYTSPVP
ncbi:MAG TPA: hypothetical protein PKO09_15215 [Anaerolineae bacterium]|nr:hypothetical protein [Anaerolineae bacterium]